jgi:hypothetical protein
VLMSLCSGDWLFEVVPNLHQVYTTLSPPFDVLNAVLDQIRLARVEPPMHFPAVRPMKRFVICVTLGAAWNIRMKARCQTFGSESMRWGQINETIQASETLH